MTATRLLMAAETEKALTYSSAACRKCELKEVENEKKIKTIKP